MRDVGLAEIVAVAAHLLLAQRLRARHPVAVHATAMAARAEAVLHGLDLHVVPVLAEGRVDAAVMTEVAVEVGEALPNADGGEVLRLQVRHLPLVDRVIGDAAQADFAVRPGLDAGPFDAVVEVPGLARRPMLDIAGRPAAAARVDAHADIAVRYPFLGVADFPALVLVGR